MPILGDEAYVLSKKYIDKQIIEAGGHTHDNKTIVDKLNADDSILTYDGVIVGSSLKSTSDNESAPLGEELLDATGWTLGEGWSGDFVNGFTHISDSGIATLSRSITNTGDKYYQISFTTSAPLVSGELTVQIGNSTTFDLYKGDVTSYAVGIKSVSDGNLVFTPTTGFNKTISNISVKEITGTFLPASKIIDSDGGVSLEIRPTLASQFNVYFGQNSGKRNTSGYANVGIGANALSDNTSGFWNIAIGNQALQKNTAGSRNLAIGARALAACVSGQRNQAIGSYALNQLTSGNYNIAIGSDALMFLTTGIANTGIGYAAGAKTVDGTHNVAIGYSALRQNVSGSNNIAIGNQALYYSKNDFNVGIGQYACYNLTDGTNNVALGMSALRRNTTGGNNVAIGYGAGYGASGNNISNNVFIGYNAGTAVTTGADGNVMIGYQAGNSITSGQRNILIGYDVDTPTAETSNYLNIGGTIIGDLLTKKITLQGGLNVANLPAADPHVAGDLWNNGGTLTVSAG